MKKGKIYLILSAFIYGFTPILAKTVYSGGTNGMTLTFLRAAMSLPLLFLVLVVKKIDLRLEKGQAKRVVLLAVVGNALSIICLYVAYSFISVGLATVLHYIYPLLIVLICALFFKERMGRRKLIAAVLVTIGILLFMDVNGKGDIFGAVMAFLSGLFYAFNVLYMDKSGLDRMHYLKLTFYISLIMSVTVFLFALPGRQLAFDMSAEAWILAGVISVLVTLCGLPLFQLGVLYEGAATAGILSTVEPITGVLLGAALLGEPLTWAGLVGCALILLGVVLIETG
ncbi:MAG TPA: EamA family transporter [Candidatus Avimonoglobus intestinipullorum]|uniref:EamA family transporter n=1 Tax=Candidatus Avimonoglobus intestinipullorum TaxID=2840699 RepID=A0A9D1S5Y1_9FIRM|nr:EamA family transporter [Candidatus Avimonoglobus intestinipullorum]